MSAQVTRSRSDVLGVLLLLALLGWVALSARDDGGDFAEMAGSVGVLAAAYLVGRFATRWTVAVVALGCLVVAVSLARTGDPRSAGPLAPPLDYANADAALAVQAAALACLGAVLVRPLIARTLLLTAAAGFVGYAVLIGSAAGAATGALVLAAGVWAMLRAPAGTRVLRSAAAVMALAAVAVTLVLGATRDTDSSGAEALTERRVALWHDAVDITVEHPLTGVGPGRFPQVSPTAMADADTQAAHSAVLEQAAETGIPGALLLVALMLWALLRTGPGDGGSRGRDAGAAAMVAVAAWLALALHTSVDYVADYPAVLAVAGLVTGLGTRQPSPVQARWPELAAGTRG
jgi:hypothetical protein